MLKKIPLLLDKPLISEEQDQFGHEHYADVLYDLITNKDLTMPYNIGLLGKWGVGKSSIKEICKNKLEKESDNVYCIDFNAWKYGGSGIKKALLREIYIKLNGSDEDIKDQFSRHITKQVMELCDNNELRKNIWNVVWNWLQIVIYNLLFCFIWISVLPNLEYLGQIFSTISLAAVLVFVTKHLLDKNNMLIPIFQNITKMDIPETTAEIYEEFLKKQLKKYKEEHKSIDKIVVFVDDIDRLPSAQEMVDGINAIRAFMDFYIDKKDNIGFVFVVSCCEYKISDALMSIKIIDDNNNDVEQYEQQTEAKRFLDKIFHFRIDIPPFPYRDMIDYSKKLLKTQIPDFEDFEAQLINSGTDIENLLCRLIYPNVQNPRQAIQILNTFFQSWNIAIRRESAEMANKAGGLAEGIVTKHPLTLAILAVLKVDFPYFYKELLIEPKLLSYVLEVLRTGVLPQFYIDPKIKDKFICVSDNNAIELKPCFYDLNQYLNLINNKFELPTSLKPFLLLNQNSLSRKYGEQAYDIEEALIHNSYEKLFNILDLKTNKLSVENAQLIKSVYESLSYDLHKENAFSVIVKLIPFISNDTRFLIDSFADTLYKHDRYRKTLSIEDYQKLLHAVSKSKIKKVIASLNKTYRVKYSYDTSSEADKQKMTLFKNASNVLLDFYNKNQEFVNEDFCNWIISPVFAREEVEEGEDFSFRFEYTYHAFENYDFLYKHASINYVKAFINEYINGNISVENKQGVYATVEKSLDYVLDNKNQEFDILLEEFIDQENSDLFDFITNYTNKNIEKLSVDNINQYLISLEIVVENKLTDNIQTEFDTSIVIETIKNIISDNFLKINSNNYKMINEFCSTLIQYNEYINDVINIISKLKENSYDDIDEIEKLLIDNIFEHASSIETFNELKLYLFEIYDSLSDDNKILLSKNIIDNTITENVATFLEEHIEEFLIEYAELIEKNLNIQIINNFLNAIYELTENSLIPNENKEYFEQLTCFLSVFIYGDKNILKNLICLVLNDGYFRSEFCKPFGQIISKMNVYDWNNDDRIIEIFESIVKEDNDDNEFDCAINIYITITRMQTDERLRTLYTQILKYNYDIENKTEWLLKIKKEKIYTTDELVNIMAEISPGEDIECVTRIWQHYIDLYNVEEREKMLSYTLFKADDVRFFKAMLELIYKLTNRHEEINHIIYENSLDSNVLNLLQKRYLITNLLMGEDRKIPSRTLLLNTKIIYNINIENKLDIIKQMLQWSYDLYNDIIRDTEIRGFQQEIKDLLNIIFKDKTYGKIKNKK